MKHLWVTPRPPIGLWIPAWVRKKDAKAYIGDGKNGTMSKWIPATGKPALTPRQRKAMERLRAMSWGVRPNMQCDRRLCKSIRAVLAAFPGENRSQANAAGLQPAV